MQTLRKFRKALTTNSSDANFPTRNAVNIKPSGNGVLDLGLGGSSMVIPDAMLVVPYGLGNNNDTFSVRILGWHHVGEGTSKTDQIWIPITLGEYACTLSAFVGIAGSPILNTEAFVDTITPVAARLTDLDIGAGTAVNSRVGINSPANDTPGHIIQPLQGVELVEFIFDQTIGTPTMNCLVAFLDDWEC